MEEEMVETGQGTAEPAAVEAVTEVQATEPGMPEQRAEMAMGPAVIPAPLEIQAILMMRPRAIPLL